MIRGSFRKEILLMLGCLNKQTMDPDTWFLFKIFVCFNMAKAVFSTEVKKVSMYLLVPLFVLKTTLTKSKETSIFMEIQDLE